MQEQSNDISGMGPEAGERIRALLISNAAQAVVRIIARFDQEARIYTISWDAEAIMQACEAWQPAVVLMDTSSIDGYLAYLLVQTQCQGLSPTIVGIENEDSWHLYQVGRGIRLVLPSADEYDIFRHLEPQQLPREIR